MDQTRKNWNNQTLDVCLFEIGAHKVHYFPKNQYLVFVTIMQYEMSSSSLPAEILIFEF